MKYIPLTQNKLALVDDVDYDYLMQWKWYFIKDGYAVRSDYSNGRIPKQIKMHREIIATPQGYLTDHINGDKLDNRRSNLRRCTETENIQNRGVQSNNKARYKGVGYQKKWNGYVARINVNGSTIYLGCFKVAEDAARAYDNAAREHHGEFAYTNFA